MVYSGTPVTLVVALLSLCIAASAMPLRTVPSTRVLGHPQATSRPRGLKPVPEYLLHPQATYSGDYYDSVANSSANGNDFRQQLSNLIYNHNAISYSAVWDAFVKLDTGLGNCTGTGKIRGFYSAYCWTESQECGNYKKEGDCFNREHSWPKSWWGGMNKGSGASTDLFLVIPADGYVNNRRSNSPLGLVKTEDAVYTSSNGAKVGPCDSSIYSGPCFEPPDVFKGDMARIYMYVSTAYYKHFDCCSEPGVNQSDIEPWLLQILMNWHLADPVSPAEMAMNDGIYQTFQKNRNPYVDHPEWAQRVFGSEP